MKIALNVAVGDTAEWQRVLAAELVGRGHQLVVHILSGHTAPPPAVRAILAAEERRAGSERNGEVRFSTAVDPGVLLQLSSRLTGREDLVIDLTGQPPSPATRSLHPLYDGRPGSGGLLSCLLQGHSPIIDVWDSGRSEHWHIGQPACELPFRLGESLTQVTSRLVEGLLRIVAQLAASPVSDRVDEQVRHGAHLPTPGVEPDLRLVMQFLKRRTRHKIDRMRRRMTGRQELWRVAWREIDDDAPMPETIDIHAYNIVEDHGARFYADPIVASQGDRRAIFVEDLSYEREYGVISCAEISSTGEISEFRTILDTGTHLSYPNMLEIDGTLYMLPEAHAAGRVELYVCEAFPDHWRHVSTLIDEPLHDATLFRHDGLFWISAGRTAFQSSTWDAMALYVSDSLEGPWRPHAGNPLVVNRRGARPAGPLWSHDGSLFRPAQDCSTGYGSALIINQVDRLDQTGFSETPVHRLAFPTGSGIVGPHTFMRHAGLEVIDFCVDRAPPFADLMS